MFGPVGQGLVGVRMHFHKESIDSGTGCRAGQRLDEFALAAGFGAAAARQLHAMRGIKDDRIAEASQNRERPHIDDEIVVPE